ncbi:tryptophan 7-halogenase [Qipengyuania sphaerica]|uniref:tryptophan 7-halogenase n=1 Tax=Qipengyuania sphaerica TaxID=2867243 RepID=UPI001C875A19|nr:tryptophan 7-halogenase [Qipengyuania sphaerica]MBX7541220.1 tryptophan 7-halogenase [Qipengyuania sphaerica]
MSKAAVDHIAICGSGLAFEACLAALARNLDPGIRITALELEQEQSFDPLYGTVTPPTAFDDFTLWGIDEPELLLRTGSSFCYGTFYSDWAGRLGWTQAYHLPLPVWDGIEFHFYLAHLQASLEPHLVSAVCGRAGRFAHPPADPNIPLSRAEYGYQIDPLDLADLLARKDLPGNVTRIRGEIASIEVDEGRIRSIVLSDGNVVDAQFFIDATGPSGRLMDALGNGFEAERTVGFAQSAQECDQLGSALRLVQEKPYGWQSQTHLQGRILNFALFHPDQAGAVNPALGSHSGALSGQLDLGARAEGWRGNCASIGHANCVIEPLTPAPMILLSRDIERLLQLVPITTDMEVEAREFNRLLGDDIEHCGIFGRAFYEVENAPETDFWRQARARRLPSKLERKLEQFGSRAILVSYDLEPFNKEDWTILHYGMKRKPERSHPFLDGIDMPAAQRRLDEMSQAIRKLSLKVPPHERYLTNFMRYLEKQHAR